MQLTDKQKLEMTETIARACGWDLKRWSNTPKDRNGVSRGGFSPFTEWNDAMRAADALEVFDISMEEGTDWSCCMHANDGSGDAYHYHHPDRLTAFCLALYEIAKVELEEE